MLLFQMSWLCQCKVSWLYPASPLRPQYFWFIAVSPLNNCCDWKNWFFSGFRRLADIWLLRWKLLSHRAALNVSSMLSDLTCLDVHILDICMCFGTGVWRCSDEIFCLVEEVHAWIEASGVLSLTISPDVMTPHFPTNIMTVLMVSEAILIQPLPLYLI